jgi:hypothetical protein
MLPQSAIMNSFYAIAFLPATREDIFWIYSKLGQSKHFTERNHHDFDVA